MNTMLKKKPDAIADGSPTNRMMENVGRPQDPRSLCRTCLHSGRCIHKGADENPVYECNEFENLQETNSRIEPSNDAREERDEVNQAAGTAKGLCANCEYRDTCMFADTIYGVWHCEEYK